MWEMFFFSLTVCKNTCRHILGKNHTAVVKLKMFLQSVLSHIRTHTGEKPIAVKSVGNVSLSLQVYMHICKYTLMKNQTHAQNVQNVLNYMLTCKSIWNLTLEKILLLNRMWNWTSFQYHMQNHTEEKHHSWEFSLYYDI